MAPPIEWPTTAWTGPMPGERAFDGGDELHGRQLIARRLAMSRHVERHDATGRARPTPRRIARELARDCPRSRAPAGRPGDRLIAPAPSDKPVAEINPLVGVGDSQHGRRPHVARAASSIIRRKNGATSDGCERGSRRQERRSAGEAPPWQAPDKCNCTYLARPRRSVSNELACEFT